ncbi:MULTISPECIES: hypothetical protein [unclassified Chryseobacterium]|jgi:hypothetical protein|uniref:hypothetical protein n=1 Tax=unclassified Chryseobacterium TaxID=2593645 RepID=UPI0030158E56
MSKSTTDLKSMVRLGGGISIDASNYSTTDLQSFARLAQVSGATIIIRNADAKSTPDLQSLARLSPGKIIFEF